MSSRPSETATFEEQWLADASSAEIRAHRLIFFVVLGPLLGLWLPYLMFYLGLSVLQIQANAAHGEADAFRWTDLPSSAGLAASLVAAAYGARRELRRLRLDDNRTIAAGMKIPERQGALLSHRLQLIWSELGGGKTAALPRLVCQPNFRILAHAYDNREGKTIEVSAGLASRIIQDDPLAISILRHEVAHLVYADLPSIRWQSVVAGAAVFSMDAAMAICTLAAVVIVVITDLHKFPLQPTAANIVSVHLAILLALILVTLPLLLGRFVVRRYAGFIVALIEMRADVNAGLWGEGLAAFGSRLEEDPAVRPSTIRDFGLAYVSPFLSHLPAQERASLLRNPGRLATPKLRYYAIAIGVIWLLNFHQGSEVWDLFLLIAVVSLLHALTVQMILLARGRALLTPLRAITLAIGLLAAQALPLISIEGLAYMADDLTAAIVTSGGFGTAGHVLQDTVDTFAEFGRFVSAGTGGWDFGLAILLTASALWLMSRLPGDADGGRKRLRTALVVVIVALVSIVVSYKFFQEVLYSYVRSTAFSSSDPLSGRPFGFWGLLPTPLRHLLSRQIWNFSEFLHGPPILANRPWGRLILPDLAAFVAALLAFGLPRLGMTISSDPV